MNFISLICSLLKREHRFITLKKQMVSAHHPLIYNFCPPPPIQSCVTAQRQMGCTHSRQGDECSSKFFCRNMLKWVNFHWFVFDQTRFNRRLAVFQYPLGLVCASCQRPKQTTI